MHSITYVSAAKILFSDNDLVALLKRCRERNRMHGITGMLLYKAGNFIQTIEGEEADVRQLYLNICKDPTHTRIIKIFDEPITQRAFPEWSMGFVVPSVVDEPGYSDFLTNDVDLDHFWQQPSEAKNLLYHFKTSLR